MIDYAKLGIIAVISVAIFGSGWWMGYSRYLEYKKSVEIAAKAQEAKVESIEKQHALVTKGIEKEYEAKIAALRNYYKSTSVWNNPNSSQMSGISAAPKYADVVTSYNQLTESCAMTTQQLVSLQDWLRQQVGIK